MTIGSIYGTIIFKRFPLSKIEKLIEKARANPENLRFKEFCSMCQYFGMKRRKKAGGHVVYKREVSPKFTLVIQDYNGMAKPYQVKQLFEKVEEYNLYVFEEES